MLNGTSILLLAAALACAAFLAVLVWRRPAASRSREPLRGEPEPGETRGDGAGALAVAAGAILAHGVAAGWPRWGPWEHQPVWVAAACGLAALVLAVAGGRRPRAASLLAAAACGIAVTLLVVTPGAGGEWEGGAAVAAPVLIAAVATALLLSTLALEARAPGPSLPLALAVTAGGVAAVALLSRYATFALVAAATAGLLAPAIAAALIRPGRRFGPGTTLASASVLAALLLGAYLHTYAGDRVPAASFILVGLAPAAAWAGEIGRLSASPRIAATIRVAATALTAAAAVGIALAAGADTGSHDAYEY